MSSDWFSFCIYFSLLGIILYYLYGGRKKNFPPGPPGLPVVGNLLSLGEAPHLAFVNYKKEYGPIFSIRMLDQTSVIISGAKLIKEAFADVALSGRPDNREGINLFLTGGLDGIAMSSGKVWTERRRFVLRQLRNFGFGKSSMEVTIMDEVKGLVDWIKKQNGQPAHLHRRFSLALVNSVWTIFSGERYDLDDENLVSILDQMEQTSSIIFKTGAGALKSLTIFFFPKIAKFFPNWSGWNNLKAMVGPRKRLFLKTIREHEKTLIDGQPRDFIDAFLLEVKNTEDPTSSFHKVNTENVLPSIMADFFLAGTDTSANTTSWAVLYLIHNPNIQRKLQEEIESVVGNIRFPSYADKEKMPYTEAFIMEVMRISSIVPVGVPHFALQDFEFHGFVIPKGTQVLADLYGCHHDPAVWGDPEVFRPERFLNEDGSKVIPSESLLPFLTGKRVCPGESLAHHQIFLILTTLVQRFNISVEPGKPNPTLKPKVGQLAHGPFPYAVVMKERL